MTETTYNRTVTREVEPWMDDAACLNLAYQGIDDHFPSGTHNQRRASVKRAKTVCAQCPLATQAACFDGALERGERFGVWGGVHFGREDTGRKSYSDADLLKKRAAFINELPAVRRALRIAGREAWAEVAGAP